MLILPELDPVKFLHFLNNVRAGQADDGEQDALMLDITVRTIEAQRTDPDGELLYDTTNIGYLKRTIDDQTIYVPFNLASVFPGLGLLEELLNIADSIKLAWGHPICVSGSTTFLGRGVPVGDLDFCEYFPTSRVALPALIAAKTGYKIGQTLAGIKMGGCDLTHPWTGLEDKLDSEIKTGTIRAKLDFIWETEAFGLMPTTSVILVVDDGFTGSAPLSSHVYQEAVIVRGNPPRKIMNLQELASYVIFLEDEISSYHQKTVGNPLSGHVFKLMKRALSLLLLIGADKHDSFRKAMDGIIADLNLPVVIGMVAQDRINELSNLKQRLPTERHEAIDRQLDTVRKRFRDKIPTGEEAKLALEAALASAAVFVEMIKDLFIAARRQPEGGYEP